MHKIAKALFGLNEWAQRYHMEKEARALMMEIADKLEALPIAKSIIPEQQWIGFILIGNEWNPTSIMNLLPRQNAVEYSIREREGSSQGIARQYCWADCTADHTPSIRLPELKDEPAAVTHG
jgi:hypothetical protein